MAPGQSYGEAIPDQVDRIARGFKAHIDLLSEVREIYREQALAEREHAGKLLALAKKATEKKAKIEALIVVGDEPTRTWDSDTLRTSTLHCGYTEIITSLVNASKAHVTLAEAINSEIVDALKALERKCEDMKKKELQFFEKLVSDKERTDGERIKSKQKYNEECLELSNYDQKQSKAQDDRHADRAAKQLEQQRNEMLNSKNLYIISTAIANQVQAKFYADDLPNLENQFQALQSTLVRRFATISTHAVDMQLKNLDVHKGHLVSVGNVLKAINPTDDQDIFIEHNIRAFSAPPNWTFEPCPSHYDTGEISVEAAPKIFLQNKLNKCRAKMNELSPLFDAKRKDLEKSAKLFHEAKQDPTRINFDEITESYLEASHQVAFYSTLQLVLQTEIDTIIAALGGDEGAQQPHSFKSSTFSIPSQCGYCKSSIWGLSKQGKTCKLCGISVHSKCELKVPAECSGSSKVHPSGARASAIASPKGVQEGSTASSFPKTPISSSFVAPEEVPVSYLSATVVYGFLADSEFELNVSEGEPVLVIEEDDGSGWVKVMNSQGSKGLVPAAYIRFDGGEDIEASPSVSPVASHQASGTFVRVLYDYHADGDDELDVTAGELIELTSGPSGGQNFGTGWWQGINQRGQMGIFPSNYVQFV